MAAVVVWYTLPYGARVLLERLSCGTLFRLANVGEEQGLGNTNM